MARPDYWAVEFRDYNPNKENPEVVSRIKEYIHESWGMRVVAQDDVPLLTERGGFYLWVFDIMSPQGYVAHVLNRDFGGMEFRPLSEAEVTRVHRVCTPW